MPRHASDPVIRSPGLSFSSDSRGTHFPQWMLDLKGTRVKGGLRLGEVLGTGAFGVVYIGAGSQLPDNRPVAVKVLSAAGIGSERRRQIEHEMLHHSRVSEHPNIVTLHSVFVDQMAYYAVMDLYTDGDLFKCITEDEFYFGNDAMIKKVFVQLLDAVEFCHAKGVYHRDLKPGKLENILCRNGGNTILLTDFGLATRDTFSQDFRCGSEFYMSPGKPLSFYIFHESSYILIECIGFPKIKAYSTVHNDIWALGVILVNLTTGRNPWKRAELQDEGFGLFYEDPAGYIADTLPLSRDALVLLLHIFRIPFKSRISISGIRANITKIDQLLLTPAEAAFAPHTARQSARHLFDIIAARRPHLLIEHYEDICAYFPDLAERICEGLRLDMSEHGLINGVDDIFSENVPDVGYRMRQELPEWSVPIPIEIRPGEFKDAAGYPQSPHMSRDNSTEGAASDGPITPDTHPTHVPDDVPEVALDVAEALVEEVEDMKINGPVSSMTTLSAFSSRIVRALGSPGSFFSSHMNLLQDDHPTPRSFAMSLSTDMTRPVEDSNDAEPPPKRMKLHIDSDPGPLDTVSNKTYDVKNLLPPSTTLLGRQALNDYVFQGSEKDVGINEYISCDITSIEGIIKQRFTDFLVYEVDLEGNVVHVCELGKPESPKAPVAQEVVSEEIETASGQWDANVDAKLSELLSEDVRMKLKQLYDEGPEPPLGLVSDSGWEGRPKGEARSDEVNLNTEEIGQLSQADNGRGRGRGRGGRGRGRGRGRERGGVQREDLRRVLTDPIPSKEMRTSVHQNVRNLFKGKFETETNEATEEEGSRVIIKWAHRGSGRRGRGRGGHDRSTPVLPPYIHFTLQKTNRDTQDALGHLARLLKVPPRELSTAGTKDKRGVTTQRVCLKRGRFTVEDVWKITNSLTGRRSPEDVVKQRGERGVRVSDINYRKGYLELGMLKGNEFVITLRNVKAESPEVIDKAMGSLKENGVAGMQRFGTSAIPTHSIGLALLRSDWRLATSLLLRPRPGEYPETEAGRRAWTEEKDLEKALRLIPRRCVAERCILENYKKHGGTDRNLLGGLSAIPRNLRLMYVHAYQSYVWNAIVSERIKSFGRTPVVGDVVYDDEGTNNSSETREGDENEGETLDDAGESGKVVKEDIDDLGNEEKVRKEWKSGKRTAPRKVKILAEEDLPHYSMFDIVMPLPGTDVAYPGGELGNMYREFLKLDGLDPNDFKHKQKEYALGGSYRKIIHHPKALSWTTMRYTDPNVPLAQSDEDAILGLDKPMIDIHGKFMALQIRLTLGTSAYATMALREVTKTETSSFHQTNLTLLSEDQAYRDTAKNDPEMASIEPGSSLADDAVTGDGDLTVEVVEGQ
ncbi:tRNA pseudouridine synthase D (TruD), partial [Rhizoctonia solani]